MKQLALISLILLLLLIGCKKDPEFLNAIPVKNDTSNHWIYDPSPYFLEVPSWFPPPLIPSNNPLTIEGIALGRKLFYDPILSGDSTQSCSSCHNQKFAFTDHGLKFSKGINGFLGNRNAMAIINLAFSKDFFWDGKSPTLEEQALQPVINPIEMHENWSNIIKKLMRHPTYPKEFYEAFGVKEFDSTYVSKALGQFMRTLVSYNSKYDEFRKKNYDISVFTPSEANGYDIYITERGDCFHCHGEPLLTDNDFHNNGLDAAFTDFGRGLITNQSFDNGKFKTPTLRNIEFTAPYMHDGRFNTLEEVIIQYSSHVKNSPNIDPFMKKVNQGGVQLTAEDMSDLIAFLKTFSDTTFINNPKFASPF